jgi:hypothetical protein
MSFPVEKQATERESRLIMMELLKFHSPAAYMGFLATLAAHRAVLNRSHDLVVSRSQLRNQVIYDADYRDALRGAENYAGYKQAKCEIDGEFLEVCFAIISAQSVMANLSEARRWLQLIHELLKNTPVPLSAYAWMPLVDVKVATGLLSKPVKQLPWERAPVPNEVLYRISPRLSASFSRLGTAFANVLFISPQLRHLLANAVIVCQFCEFNASDSQGLATHEHIMYRCKTHELEYDILTYVYSVFPRAEEDPALVDVPPLEQLIRLAVLGLMSSIAAVVHPGTGIGRGVTSHQMKALDNYCTYLGPDMDKAEMRVILWVLFIYAAGARDQPEAPHFEYFIAQTATWLGLKRWEDAEKVILEGLYVPRVLGTKYSHIWERASREAMRRGLTQTMAIR